MYVYTISNNFLWVHYKEIKILIKDTCKFASLLSAEKEALVSIILLF